jgi:oxaloacetate decarboxylase alpha subunit
MRKAPWKGQLMRRVGIVDQTFRDAPQCLWASRMTTAMMLPVATKMDDIGFDSIDAGGNGSGADVAVRFLKENPWERGRLLRERIQKTPMTFAVRARNDIAFKIAPRDIQFLWVERKIRGSNGFRNFRLFDPLQDLDNIVPALKYAKELGAYTIGALAYGLSPVHTDAMYMAKAQELIARANVDAIMIKDAGGLLTPDRIRTLVPALKSVIGSKILELHSHCMTGLAPLVYHEGVRLGVDQIHTSIAPLANGNAQPAMQTMVRNLREMGYQIDTNDELVEEVSEHFRKVAEQEGKPVGRPMEYDAFHFEHQLPGGMISNFKSQLSDLGKQDLLPEILQECVRVRRELGWPILITPFAQIVGTQAFFNVMQNERYKVVTDEVKRYVLGHNGKLLAPVDADILDRIIENGSPAITEKQEEPEPGVPALRRKYPDMSDEERLLRYSYAGSQVDDMLAANTPMIDYEFKLPLSRLMEELAKSKAKRVYISRPDLTIDLRA